MPNALAHTLTLTLTLALTQFVRLICMLNLHA